MVCTFSSFPLLFNLVSLLRGICFNSKRTHYSSCHSAHIPNLFGRVDVSKKGSNYKNWHGETHQNSKTGHYASCVYIGYFKYLEITLSTGVTQKSLINGLVNHVIFTVTFTALIRSLCKVDTKVAFSNSKRIQSVLWEINQFSDLSWDNKHSCFRLSRVAFQHCEQTHDSRCSQVSKA